MKVLGLSTNGIIVHGDEIWPCLLELGQKVIQYLHLTVTKYIARCLP